MIEWGQVKKEFKDKFNMGKEFKILKSDYE